jgi:hypothetical protein
MPKAKYAPVVLATQKTEAGGLLQSSCQEFKANLD